MHFLTFHKTIKSAIDKQSKISQALLQTKINKFINALDKLNNNGVDEFLNMTRLSILFEGFYRHLDIENTSLKKMLVEIRAKRWVKHFGTPIVPFLLSYKNQIDETKLLFDELGSLQQISQNVPWFIHKEPGFVNDLDNNILIDPNSITRVMIPSCREVAGIFTKTHNPFGGFTTAPCDPVSQRFIAHAANVAKNDGKVLEIGAAFGAATLEAITKGAAVFCNDIEPENLAVVQKRLLESIQEGQTDSITGDSDKLVLIPGELPHELIGLPENSFDAILICRVLHFFTGAKIEESLRLMLKLLTQNGKIYIVCETPFLKNWQRFIPEFKNRVENGEEWPGEITNPANFESSGRAASLPKFVHWITKEILERSLLRTGFGIEHSAYINRAGQFPDDLLLPEQGKESIGAIGIKENLDYEASNRLV